MRNVVYLTIAWLCLSLNATLGHAQSNAPFTVKLVPGSVNVRTIDKSGRPIRMVTVQVAVEQKPGVAISGKAKYLIEVLEQKEKAVSVEVPRRKETTGLDVVLAIDTSGSMKKLNKREKAITAAKAFLSRLPKSARVGLVLFNHKAEKKAELTTDHASLVPFIEARKASGGTAYLDACLTALDMLQKPTKSSAGQLQIPKSQRDLAIVVMTDGVDLNSTTRLDRVIERAIHNKAPVKIHTVGIGKAGEHSNVTSMLVLDHSGSMKAETTGPDGRPVAKLAAVKKAAKKFVDSLRSTNSSNKRTSVLKFSGGVNVPQPFTNKRWELLPVINQLDAFGETAFYDATFTAIEALAAENPPGKRAVIALTDGVDNLSRRRVEEVIARAKEANVALFPLGFGEKGEFDETVLKLMADQTKGEYFPAKSGGDLIDLFEKLSILLHDDGIDEEILRKLAYDTQGQYYHVEDVDKMELALREVVKGIENRRISIEFESRFQRQEGLTREIQVQLVEVTRDKKDNAKVVRKVLGKTEKERYQNPALLLAQTNPLVYLVLLGILGALLAIPTGIGRLTKSTKS
ncbi:MAG: VWA domain-containing protein [Gemmataceae bacterium]